MTTYRTQIKIVADILVTVRDNAADEGVGVTFILRKANLSYLRLERILRDLVGSGLILPIGIPDGPTRYKISSNGLRFLEVYDRFEQFARSLGLRL